MALDQQTVDLLTTEIMVGTRESARLTGMGDRNLTQGLGVIHNTVIQSVASTADDAQLFGALSASDRVPIPKA